MKQPTTTELSVEELEVQAGEALPVRTLMSLFSTSSTGTLLGGPVPPERADTPVDYANPLQFDPFPRSS